MGSYKWGYTSPVRLQVGFGGILPKVTRGLYRGDVTANHSDFDVSIVHPKP